MAQLKDSLVSGSLRVTDNFYTSTAQFRVLNAPTSSNGTTYGPGTSGYVLKSNGTSVYWGADNNAVTGVKGSSESTYRTGQVSISAANIGLGNVENTKLSTWTGTSTIATVGTITNGTWQGTAIAPNYISGNTTTTRKFLRSVATTEGTAGTPAWDTVTKTDVGLNNVTNDAQIPKSVGTTKGDIIYFTGASEPTRLGIGSAGTLLTAAANGPVWTSVLSIGHGGTGATSFTDNCVIVPSTTSNVQSLGSTGLKVTGATDAHIELSPYTNGKNMTVSTTTGILTIKTNGTSGGNLVLKTDGSSGTVTVQSDSSSVSILSGTNTSIEADGTVSISSGSSTSINATTFISLSSTTTTSITSTTDMTITSGDTLNIGSTDTLTISSDNAINIDSDENLTINTATSKAINFQKNSTTKWSFSADGTNISPAANSSISLGTSSYRWSALFVGSNPTYGNAYQPVYWNNGVPAISYPVQYSTWSISQGDNTATLTGTDIFTIDTYVISLVVTSGEQYLNGPITWTSAANTLTLSTAATSGIVEGYVLTSIGTATSATCVSSSVTTNQEG